MKEYLTLRLPTALARALARWARVRGVPKSAIVREAVARYLAPTPLPESAARRVTARELTALLGSLPHLSLEEAAAFARDLETARSELGRLEAQDPWES